MGKFLMVGFFVFGFSVVQAQQSPCPGAPVWRNYNCSAPVYNDQNILGVGYQLMCSTAMPEGKLAVVDCQFYSRVVSPGAMLQAIPLQQTYQSDESAVFVADQSPIIVTVKKSDLNAEVHFPSGAVMNCLVQK